MPIQRERHAEFGKQPRAKVLRNFLKATLRSSFAVLPIPPPPKHTYTHTISFPLCNLSPKLATLSILFRRKGGRGFSILPDCCQCIHIKVACHMDFLLVYFESVLRAFDQDFGARTPSVGIKAAKKGAINRVRGELSTPIAK